LIDGKMIQIGSKIYNQHIGIRLARLPLVMLLTIGLLVSLIHCTDGVFSLAKADSVVAMTMPADQGSSPDMPEHLSRCHSGHCLSHVSAQPVAIAMIPLDRLVRSPAFGRDQVPASMAGLPLFKPPRV
jgi:hypothetical protein